MRFEGRVECRSAGGRYGNECRRTPPDRLTVILAVFGGVAVTRAGDLAGLVPEQEIVESLPASCYEIRPALLHVMYEDRLVYRLLPNRVAALAVFLIAGVVTDAVRVPVYSSVDAQ